MVKTIISTRTKGVNINIIPNIAILLKFFMNIAHTPHQVFDRGTEYENWNFLSKLDDKAKRFANAEISAAYGKFRPVYPKSVGDIITSYMRSSRCSGFECAVDAACGTGQSTFLLSDHRGWSGYQ